MNTLVIGLNHKTADIDIREKLAFDGPKMKEGLLAIRDLPGIKESVIISTCNRVEIYLSAGNTEKAVASTKDFIARFHNIKKESLNDAFYIYHDLEAVRHIYRVASSLDSMVVGEPQILGQLKEAFDFSLKHKTTGILLNRLFKKAISVAKRIRTETRIAENAVSISFAAVELSKKIFTELTGKTFMLLGAGEMAELAAKHIINNGVTDILIANRTYQTGCDLAKEFSGRAVHFEHFLSELKNTDIIICSTGASDYVLTKSQMHKVMKERKNKSVFIIDISVPRNIDPEINHLDNVYLYSIDDLQGVVDTNVLERQKEAEKAEKIVEEEIETFSRWLSSLDSVPTVVALRKKADDIKAEEIEKLTNRLPHMGEKEKEAVEQTINSVINKLIHAPTIALKESSEDRDILIATIKRLYGLEGNNEKN